MSTERRECFVFAGLLLKQLQKPEQSCSEAVSQEPLGGLPRGCWVPRTGVILSCFPGQRQRTRLEVEHLGHEPASTWDASAIGWRISQLSHYAGLIPFLEKDIFIDLKGRVTEREGDLPFAG